MAAPRDALLDAWRINDCVTRFLVESLPPEAWGSALPQAPRRTVRSLAAHLHNSRRLWLKGLAVGAGVHAPAGVDPARVSPAELLAALARSGAAVLRLLEAGLASGGRFPGVGGAFYFGAMPRDVALFVGYALSHEAHHRGQLLLMTRLLGHRVPAGVAVGLWQWSSRLRESRGGRPAGAPARKARRS